MAANSTTEAIERDAAQFAALGGQGLPYTWVNARVILGADRERLVDTIDAALSGSQIALPTSALLAVLAAAFAVGGAFSWRPPRPLGAARAAAGREPEYAPPTEGG